MPKATSSGGSDFAPVPSGTTLGICYGVIDIGTPPPHGNFPSRRKVLLMFELPQVRADFSVNGETKNLARVISVDYTLSTDKKANLRKQLAAWRGRDFTEEEAKVFEVGNVAGAMALLSIVHKQSADKTKTYANIASIMKPMAGTPKMKAENPHVIFDIPESGPIVIPETIPEWIANRIKASDEYVERANPHAVRKNQPQTGGEAFPGNEGDSDVPF